MAEFAATPKTGKRKSVKLGRGIFYLMLTFMVVMFILPFAFVIFTSFRTTPDMLSNGIFSWPAVLTIQNYIDVFTKGNFSSYLTTSIMITVPSVVGGMTVASLAAYALARLRFKGRKSVFFLILSCMYVPGQMLLIPIYRIYSNLGLTDSLGGIIILHITLAVPFGVFVLRNFFVTVPMELQDAAIIDGCNDFQIYSKIMMPLSLPSLAVLGILQFTFIWNSFVWELMLMTDHRPVMVGVANLQGEYTIDWAAQCAGAILASIPTLIMFLSFQRYFIGGLTVGSVKG